MRPISLFVASVVAVVVGNGALAGPFDELVLRGSTASGYDRPVALPRFVPGNPIRYRWEGLYVGAHAAYTQGGFDFANGTESLIAYILRNDVVGNHVSGWTTLSKLDSGRPSFGVFIGKNIQLDDLVIGVEVNYSRVAPEGLYVFDTDSMTRTFNDDTAAPPQHHYFYTATVTSTASARLTDYGTVRARAGVTFDKFLPYAFAGFAIGRVDILRSATVAYLREDIPDNAVFPDPPIVPEPDFFFGPVTRSQQKNGAVAFGYTAGLGMEVALMPNMFMRAEWEYIQFLPVQDFTIHLNTVRAGLGLKF
jgi:opacity protein-like surface antigen